MRTVTSDSDAALPLLRERERPLPIRGDLWLRRSDERLRGELPALACPATVAISSKKRTERRIGHRPRQGRGDIALPSWR